MSDDNNLPKPIAIVIGITTSVITFISAIVGFVLLWKGNSEVVSIVVTAVSILGLWGSFFYIKFSKKSTPPKKETEEQQGHKRKHKKTGRTVFVFSKKIRQFALYGIIALPVIALSTWGIYYYTTNRPPKEVVILILEFDGPESQNYGVTQFFVEKISQVTKGINFIEMEISDKVITSRDGYTAAYNLGLENNANIVVWGWYVASDKGINVTYHITTIQKNYGLGFKGVSDHPTNLSAEKERTDSFDFQSKELTDALVYDTLTTIYAYLFQTGKFYEALDIENILIDYLDTELISNPDYNVYKAGTISSRAVLYYMMGDINRAKSELDIAVNLSPDKTTYSNRATILFYLGDIEGAKQDLIKAKEIAPYDSSLYSDIAIIYRAEGEFEKAVAELSDGIEKLGLCTIENGCHELYYLRGLSYISLGKKEEAKADFNVIKELIGDPEVSKILDSYLESAP